jgi:hypothetical protein
LDKGGVPNFPVFSFWLIGNKSGSYFLRLILYY